MNKLFSKIAGLSIGLAMAIGVGVAVASSSKEATPVHAASATWNKITADPVSGTSYLIVSSDGKELFDGSQSTIDSTSNHINNSSGYGTSFTGDYDDKVFTFTKSGSDWYIQSAAGSYIGRSSNSNGITTATSQGNTVKNTITNSSGAFTIKGTSTRYLSYNSSSGRFRYFASGTVMLFEKAATKTLSSIAVSGYTTAFTVGDTFSFGGTVTATYSDSSTANVTSSATFSGYNMSTAGSQTVTASYTEGGVTKTATYGITVSAATSTYITPAKASTSGYTGQNETLSFTYGNLTSTLGVSSSNTSVVTVGTPSASAGSGTVQINFVGAGSTTVKFKDGSTELASVSVSVTASSVTINGLPASKSISSGGTFNLGSLITVTATGSYSSDVTWESDDDSIVSVTSTGVITGESIGTTNVTVTSDDYPTATMTCSVTVANMISAVFASGTSDGTTAVTNSDNLINNYGYTVDSNIYFPSLTAVYPKANNAVKLGGSSTKGSMTIGLVDGKVSSKNAYITKITVNAMAYGTDSTSITINGTSKTLTSSFADYDVDVTGTSTTSIAIEASATSKQRFRIQYINVFYANPVELSSVTTSGQNTSFTAGNGNKWSYGGTLTAHYSDSSSATKTPTSFKYGASGINPTTAGTEITTNTTLDHDTHNGKYIYVIYTEDDITKWASYQITVNYAAVTSVVINTHAAEIGLNETYDYTLVGVTINTSYADPGYEWVVSGNTVSDDYTFDGSGLKSKDTEGTITLRCRSTADNSKYDELVVTVTGDPTAEFKPESVAGYAGKSTDVAFTYGNMDDENLIAVTSGNTSYVTIGGIAADEGEGLVTVNFVAAGSTTISISYDGGETLASITVTVSSDSVTAVNWSASNIKVYSGAVLTADIDDTWEVNYEMASGDADYITYGDYTVKLGGSTITLPHTWAAADDGKALCVEYGGVQSSTVSVGVTQTLRPVMADITSESTYTFSANTWTYSEGSGEWSGSKNGNGYTSGQGVQMTTSQDGTTVTSASSYSNISQIVITYNTNKSSGAGSFDVKVGTNASQNVSAAWQSGDDGRSMNYTATFDYATKQSGVVAFTVNVGTNSLWVKSIKIVTSTGSTDIANKAGHEAAQKAVVKFAKAFNAALGTTEHCTTGLSSAWSTASSAWDTFLSEAAALGETEEAYAKSLIKNATAQWTDDTDENFEYCLERALATYEKCVTAHGQEKFMNSVRPVGRFTPINILQASTKTAGIVITIITVSAVSLAAIGGYFLFRKKKED
jgi:hypothetical protein